MYTFHVFNCIITLLINKKKCIVYRPIGIFCKTSQQCNNNCNKPNKYDSNIYYYYTNNISNNNNTDNNNNTVEFTAVRYDLPSKLVFIQIRQ